MRCWRRGNTSNRMVCDTTLRQLHLADARHAQRQVEPRLVGCHRQDRAEAWIRGQTAQQTEQRGEVEAQRGAVADVARQAPLHRTQAGRAGEDDNGALHP